MDIVHPPEGIVSNHVNTVEVLTVGNRFIIWVNGYAAIDFTDVDEPYLTGGVGLYAVWESHVRFDYIVVTEPPPIAVTETTWSQVKSLF